MSLKAYLCFFTGRKWSFMYFWLVWCMQKKNACPDDRVAAETFPEELKWDCWTCLPAALILSCLLRKGRSQWWWLVIPSFLVDLLHKFPELSESYFGASPKMLSDANVNFAIMVFNLLLKWRTWELGLEKFPLWFERDLLRWWNTMEAMCNWSLSSENEGESHKSFCCYSETATVKIYFWKIEVPMQLNYRRKERTHI